MYFCAVCMKNLKCCLKNAKEAKKSCNESSKAQRSLHELAKSYCKQQIMYTTKMGHEHFMVDSRIQELRNQLSTLLGVERDDDMNKDLYREQRIKIVFCCIDLIKIYSRVQLRFGYYHWSKVIEKERIINDNNAAICIQHAFSSYISRQRRKNNVANSIRHFKQKRLEVKIANRRQKNARIKIQSLIKERIHRRRIRHMRNLFLCATQIQCAYRCYHAKLKLRSYKIAHNSSTKAAIKVQAWYRSHKATCKVNLLKNIRVVESKCLKQKIYKENYHDIFIKLGSAYIIQRAWRCFKFKYQLQCFINYIIDKRRNKAEIFIQILTKRYISKLVITELREFKRYKQIHEELSAECIQKIWRVFKAKRSMKQLKYDYKKQKLVSKMQKTYLLNQNKSYSKNVSHNRSQYCYIF